MNRTLIISLIFLILVVLCHAYFLRNQDKYINYDFSVDPILFYRITDTLNYKNPSLMPIQPYTDIMSETIYDNYFQKTDVYDKAEWIMFETFNNIDVIMKQIKFPSKIRFVFGLAGTDMLVSKSALALTLTMYLDEKDLKNTIPSTYVLENAIDKDKFINDYKPNGTYIMKKNIQRQEGIVITKDRNTILYNFNTISDYVVVQELLKDPMLVSLRKINIRIYLLVVIGENNNNNSMYMYGDGFMYYTPLNYKDSTNIEENITTGYIDRKVYEDNPLTLRDLYLSMPPQNASILSANILKTMKTIAQVYLPLFAKQNGNLPGNKFIIYGVDLAPSASFDVKVMEVNKGPDLSYKDVRDKELKLNMVQEALGIVGIMPKNGSLFIQLVSP